MSSLYFVFSFIYILFLGLGRTHIFKHLNYEGKRTMDAGYWWTTLNPCMIHNDNDLRELTGTAYQKMLDEVAGTEKSLGRQLSRPPMMAGLYDGSKCVFASTFQGTTRGMKYFHPNLIQIEMSRCGFNIAVLDFRRGQARHHINPEAQRLPHIKPAIHRYVGHCAEIMAISRYFKEYYVSLDVPRDKWIMTVHGNHERTRIGSSKQGEGTSAGPQSLCSRRKDSSNQEIPGRFSCQNFAKHMGVRYLSGLQKGSPLALAPHPNSPPLPSTVSRKRPRPGEASSTSSGSRTESGEIVEERKRRKIPSIESKSSSISSGSQTESGEIGERRKRRKSTSNTSKDSP